MTIAELVDTKPKGTPFIILVNNLELCAFRAFINDEFKMPF